MNVPDRNRYDPGAFRARVFFDAAARFADGRDTPRATRSSRCSSY